METGIYLVSLLALLASLLLSACAGVDASVLDTAECLGKGTWGAGMAYTMAIRPPEWLNIDGEHIYDNNSVGPCQYLELEYGMADDVDTKLRLSLHPDGNTAKLLVKKQLAKDDKFSSAIVLGGGVTQVNQDLWEPYDDYGHQVDYQMLTGELQMILTQQFKKNNFVSFAIRGNYHRLFTELQGHDRVQDDFYHGGLRVNYKRYHRGFYAILELGAEAPLSTEDWNSVYPWIGLKFSWDIKKKI